MKDYKNVCIRCGTERVASKVTEEKFDNSVVITTYHICPNILCQKQVDRENKKVRDKYLANKLRSEERHKMKRLTKVAKQ